MADVITTLHPEGIPTDNLYPNIKKENLPSDLQQVIDFALSQYEKTLNLWDEEWEVGVFNINTGEPQASINTIRTKNLIKVNGGEQYYAYIGSNNDVWCFFYDENNTLIENVGTSQFPNAKQIKNSVFTTPSNCSYIKFYLVAYGVTYNHDITISEGDHSVGYLPYNGDILHTIDVEGVKLWANGNPTSLFGAQIITTSNMSEYKFIAVEFLDYFQSDVLPKRQLVRKDGNGWFRCLSATDATNGQRLREFEITSATTISVKDAYTGATQTNEVIIPVAIYGIK